MKFYLAATAVLALAKQASAYRIVQNDGPGPKYCIQVVKYASSTYNGWDTGATPDGVIDATLAASLLAGDPSSTVGPNGKNDPLGAIKTAAQTAFSGWTSSSLSFTIYTPGGTTAASPQPADKFGQTTIDFCPLYSTYAPDHYCKGDGVSTAAGSTTIDACCKANHPNDYAACYEASAGIAPMGDVKFYANYAGEKCVRNCDTDNLFNPTSTNALSKYLIPPIAELNAQCGGIASSTTTTYSTAPDCCKNSLSSLSSGYCEHVSNGSTAASYAGSNKWYVDSANQICVQDCVVGTPGNQCGGTIKLASPTLYADAATCCKNTLPWVSACTERSTAGKGNPTSLYWDSPNGCRKDCTVTSTNVNCAPAPSTATLYADASTCCKSANSWINLNWCVSRADPTFSYTATTTPSATNGGTSLWYVNYVDGVCRKDCFKNPSVTANAGCDFSLTGSTPYYTSAADCCKTALAWTDKAACETGSASGQTITTVATDQWYVSYNSDRPCKKDCAVGTTGTAVECGGIVAKTGVRMYASATECCKNAYSWMNQDLCEKESLNAGTPTYKWYVNYGSNSCYQDCETATSPIPSPPTSTTCYNPKGRPEDSSIQMFSSASECCKARLAWVKLETCVTTSETGVSPSSSGVASPGLGEWRKNNAWSTCVLDCVEGATIATGAPILTTQPLLPYGVAALVAAGTYPVQCDGVTTDSSAVMYKNSVENCCKSISWVQAETCKALSLGAVSQMYFQDPSDPSKCVANQAASVSAGTGITVTCDVSGKVTSPADATGVSCVSTIQPSTKLYSSLDTCCGAISAWDKEGCKYKSRGTSAPGTLKYYISWVNGGNCVQDCPRPAGTGSPCAGVANAWQTLYPSATECCKALTWVPSSKCMLYT